MHSIEDFNMDLFSLKEKNAIVTGGNSGLGTRVCDSISQSRS